MQKILKIIGDIVDVLSMILVCGVLFVLLIGVFFRYVLQAPLFWSDMFSVNLFTWLLFLGTAVSVRLGTMFKIELISHRFSEKGKLLHKTFVTAVCVFVYAVLCRYGWDLTLEQVKLQLFAFPELFPFINFAWIYISIPVAFFLMILFEINGLYQYHLSRKEDAQ